MVVPGAKALAQTARCLHSSSRAVRGRSQPVREASGPSVEGPARPVVGGLGRQGLHAEADTSQGGSALSSSQGQPLPALYTQRCSVPSTDGAAAQIASSPTRLTTRPAA